MARSATAAASKASFSALWDACVAQIWNPDLNESVASWSE